MRRCRLVGLIDTLTSLQEKNMPFGVMLRTGFFQVKDETAPIVKAVTIKSQSCAGSMREDTAGEQTFTVEVELARARPEESVLRFEIEDETEANREDSDCDDCAGIRDIDYKADILPLRIPPKTTKGTTTLTVTSADNEDEDGDKIFMLKAFLADETPATTLFTISDDETATTSVMLCADPGQVVSGEGPKEITVTAEINGREFDEDQTFTLILNHNRESDKRTTAERDIDFTAIGGQPLTIKAGEINWYGDGHNYGHPRKLREI